MIEIRNKKANYDYTVLDSLEAGIVLKGTEIKSIRKGSCDLKDTFIHIKNNEAYVINMYIAKYEEGNIFNHEERRTRKLLLHKKEILKINNKLTLEGYTLVPVKLYFVKNKAKILLGIAKGKKQYDKRAAMKEKEQKKEAKFYY